MKKLLIILLFFLMIFGSYATVDVTYKDLMTDTDLVNTTIQITGKVSIAQDNTMIFYMGGDSDQKIIVNLPENENNHQYKNYEGLPATVTGVFDGVHKFGWSGNVPYINITDIE